MLSSKNQIDICDMGIYRHTTAHLYSQTNVVTQVFIDKRCQLCSKANAVMHVLTDKRCHAGVHKHTPSRKCPLTNAVT